MTEASDTSRNNDMKSLKDNIIKYVLADLTSEEKILLGDIKSKRCRGFRNRILTGYLVPALQTPEFKKDPEA